MADTDETEDVMTTETETDAAPAPAVDGGISPGGAPVPAEAVPDTPGTAPSFESVMRTVGMDVHYGDFKAVENVHLDFPENEITALIGPSGCGKSTVLRCLNRMNDLIPSARVSGGGVFLHDKNIYDEGVDPVEIRRRVGMVFQQPNPFSKSIYDNVAWGAKINGFKGRKSELDDLVEQSLTQAALWGEVKDKLNESGYSLSGGQQQRLCIARAVAPSPEVLLMDEPCSALDPIATLRIEELMLDLKKDY
jgi:phosphate transport system ATP-binding protein